MKRGFKGLLLIMSTSLALVTSAQQRHELTAKEAVEYARKNNASVKNALVDVQIQAQTNREITANAFPQINGNVGINYFPSIGVQRFPNFIAAGTYGVLTDEGVKDANGNAIVMPNDFGFIEAAFGSKFNNSIGVDLQQLLFEGQVFVGLQARRTSMEFAQKNVEVTEENIKANIYKIYYQLSAGKNQLNILDANISRLEKLSGDTRKLYDNGFAEKLDIDKVTVQQNNLVTEKQKVQNTISNGYIGLKILMGMPVKDTLVLTDSVTYDEIRNGVLDATLYNYSDRKEYQYAELGKKLNEYNIRRYKLTYYPTVALSSNYALIRQSNKFGFGGSWNPSSQIGLRVSVPIFDGYARAARVQRARLELEQTENRIEELKLSIDSDVQQAINNYSTALVTLDNQKRNMELAEKVYGQTKKKYEIGTGSTIEINDADTELRIAQTNYINALYDAIIAKIDFLKATGKLQ
ncbi:MAG: TolC family protein [Bacteroidota bacterium]|nr:TolC family protein [Bacteroidota bacterium]